MKAKQNGSAWQEELRKILDDYKEGNLEEPLDGDAVELLIDHLRNKINLMEGNITEDEYLDLEEKGDMRIKITVKQPLDGHNWEKFEEVIKDALVQFGVNACIENPNTGNTTIVTKSKKGK